MAPSWVTVCVSVCWRANWQSWVRYLDLFCLITLKRSSWTFYILKSIKFIKQVLRMDFWYSVCVGCCDFLQSFFFYFVLFLIASLVQEVPRWNLNSFIDLWFLRICLHPDSCLAKMWTLANPQLTEVWSSLLSSSPCGQACHLLILYV